MKTRRRNSNDVYLTMNLMKKMPINGVEQGKEKGGFIIIAETTCRIASKCIPQIKRVFKQ
jgi:hypothetical protein